MLRDRFWGHFWILLQPYLKLLAGFDNGMISLLRNHMATYNISLVPRPQQHEIAAQATNTAAWNWIWHIQTKSAENWDDELTQSVHLRNSHLALYTVVGYTSLYLRLTLCKTAKNTCILDLWPYLSNSELADNWPKDGSFYQRCIGIILKQIACEKEGEGLLSFIKWVMPMSGTQRTKASEQNSVFCTCVLRLIQFCEHSKLQNTNWRCMKRP